MNKNATGKITNPPYFEYYIAKVWYFANSRDYGHYVHHGNYYTEISHYGKHIYQNQYGNYTNDRTKRY